MKLSKIFGMNVFVTENGAHGYVVKVYADGKKITGFLCADESENEFFAPSSDVKFTDGGITFAPTGKAKPQAAPIALGRACFSASGEYIGTLKDIECRGLKLAAARIGVENYAASGLIFGDVIIIKPNAAG